MDGCLSYEEQIKEHEREVQRLWKLIVEREKDARDAYNRSQGDVHNLYGQAWQELTEEQRDEWRFKFGISRRL